MNTGTRRNRPAVPRTPTGPNYRVMYEQERQDNDALRGSRMLAWFITIGVIIVVLLVVGIPALGNAVTSPGSPGVEYRYTTLKDHYNEVKQENMELRATNDHLESLLDEQTLRNGLQINAAVERCEQIVQDSMANTAVDTLGNPLNVSAFAEETCWTERSTLGDEAFIEKFPSQG
ncbi:hypothetical protein SEA_PAULODIABOLI_277 [Microbacterium phage PauloDiaboli]|nr:hypothetical protein SEA_PAULODIABOLI_277 [Microbacterium phage PauloDiaboli]QWY84084.1 hypothetical protein SEA_A3WALLY_277 [Microbacterium phage A3Wally]